MLLDGVDEERCAEILRLQDEELLDLTRITDDELRVLHHVQALRDCRCEDPDRATLPFCTNLEDCEKMVPIRAIEGEMDRRGRHRFTGGGL